MLIFITYNREIADKWINSEVWDKHIKEYLSKNKDITNQTLVEHFELDCGENGRNNKSMEEGYKLAKKFKRQIRRIWKNCQNQKE